MSSTAEDLLEAMPDTVKHYRFLGDDAAGNERYAKVPETLAANITITMRKGGLGDREGQLPSQVPVTGSIIVLGDNIRPRDRIDFLGITKQVDTIQTFRDAPERGYYVQVITYDEEK